MADFTPAAWLTSLSKQLNEQALRTELYMQYYDGDHRLTLMTERFKQTFGMLFRSFASNWCPIVVDASVERLGVEGFRFGDDHDADDAAWEFWQRNNLDAYSAMAHTEAVKCGVAFVLVGPGDGSPEITVEHPLQVTVAFAPGNRRVRLAALKRWIDETGHARANVYLPDSMHRFMSKDRIADARDLYYREPTWVRPDEAVVDNPLGVVPVVPLMNSPTMLSGGRSDLEVAIPLQDAINKVACDLLLASEYAAFPQRVAMGIEVPRDPETGVVLPGVELEASLSRFWAFENENARIDQFQAADLANYVNGINLFERHLTAQTRTPPHYVMGQIVNASGDALKAAETGLVAKVRRKQLDFADGWEEAMRLAFRLEGDERRGREARAETIWRDPETRSVAETVDALGKLTQMLGVPPQELWPRVPNTSQQDVERWRAAAESGNAFANLTALLDRQASEPVA